MKFLNLLCFTTTSDKVDDAYQYHVSVRIKTITISKSKIKDTLNQAEQNFSDFEIDWWEIVEI